MKQLKPKNGPSSSGDLKPAAGYIGVKFMKAGEEFRGTYRSTFKKMVTNDEGREYERRTHYFTATAPGQIRKVNPDTGDTSYTEYKAGDEVGINGTAQLDDAILGNDVQPGTNLVIIKRGTAKNKSGKGSTQLVDVFEDDSSASAAPASKPAAAAAAPSSLKDRIAAVKGGK